MQILKMLLTYVLLLNVINASYQFNITKDLTKLAIPELYAERIKEHFTINEKKTLCQQHMDVYADKLLSGKNMWALNWFDSGTKIPSGILRGHFVDLGNFDECVEAKTSINNLPVYGKYCLASIPLRTTKVTNTTGNERRIDIHNIPKIQQPRAVNSQGEIGFQFATCMPDSCTSEEIQEFYTFKSFPKITFSETSCYSQSTKPTLTNGDIAFITFLGVVLIMIILSTIYDIYLFYANQKPLHVLLKAFSVFTNGKKLITFSSNPNQISCLHGLRAISMMWVILGHRLAVFVSHPMKNIIDLLPWVKTVGNMYILGGTVSVDTFFLLSGLVLSYVFMSSMNKGAKFNVFIFYIHRYLRLTPLYAIIMVLYITVLIHLGSGPYWQTSISALSKPCQDNWWKNLLYVQNYVTSNGQTCLGQAWYLAVDTQLYFISPLILIPLWKWPKIGISIASSLAVASMIASFIIGFIHKLYGFILANEGLSFFTEYYITTHTRATPWFMGIILGYYIFKIKKNQQKIVINKILVLLTWLVALGVLAACVFTGHNTLTDEYDRIGNAFYLSLMRPGWALGVSAVIVLCELGYGGPVNWFLSVPIFEFLSRLTYSMYLIHMGLLTVIMAQNRSSSHINDLTLMHGYWGDYIFTMCTAVIFTLAFESPLVAIEKYLLGGKPQKKETDVVESIKTT